MSDRNKKLMDGIQRNSNNARKVFSYADFRKMKDKNYESGIKNYGKISNFKIIFNSIISNVLKIIKFKNSNFIQNSKFKIKNSFRRYLFSRNFLRKATALMIIFSVLVTAYFQNTNRALSATYTWTQTNWNSQTANNTGHPAPADWTEYSAKDTNITTGSTVTLTLNSGSNAQTTDADFSGGTNSNTTVGSNSVALELTGATAWTNSTLASSAGTVGTQNSIAIGSDGFARISYFDYVGLDYGQSKLLKFAQCTNADCSTKNTSTVWNNSSGNRAYSSMTLGPDGFTRITGPVGLYNTSKFYKCTNADCSTNTNNTFDGGGLEGDSSIVMGSDGFARITYYDIFAEYLRFVQCTNANCSTSSGVNLDGLRIGSNNSVAMGLDGFGRVAYYEHNSGFNLKFAQCTNDSCSTKNITTIDSTGTVGNYPSIAVGSDGFARISYYDATNADLKFVQCTNADCSTKNISTVDSTDSVGSYTSLVLGSDGFARIAYYDSTNGNLKFAQCTNADCSTKNITTVDNSAEDVGKEASLALNSSGLGRISYHDATNLDLKYAYEYPAYYSSGTFTSSIIDSGQTGNWENLSWNATLNGQTIAMKARTCDDASCSGEPAFSSCSDITSGSALSTGGCATNGHRYVQYQASLSGDTISTPTLDDVTIGYNYYLSSKTLTSSKYDTTDAANVLAGLSWSETLLTGADVKFQVRTSADGNTWTNWCGPDNGTTGCDTGTYFTDPAGSETPDADMMDGSNDRWIQYQATLTSTGVNTPTLSDVTMSYVVNATPSVTVNSATQNSDGTISINYNLSDADSSSFTVSVAADIGITLNETLDGSDTTITLSSTALLPTSGTIQIDSEQISYTGKSGNDLTGCARGANNTSALTHSSAAVIWAKATTASGNIGGSQTTGNGKTISWTINTDYDGVYRNASQGKIRVSANDGDAANQVGNGDSSMFVIDTKDPTGFSITSIDHTQDKVLITAATEDSNYEMYIDNASGTLFDAGKITSPLLNQASSYPNNYTYSSMTADPATVYVGVKDEAGNTAYVQMTTPAKPNNPIYFDTSSSSQGTYQEFLAWDVVSAAQVGSGFSSYKVYRKIDSGSYSLLTTVTDRNTNYYLDKIKDTDPDTTDSDPSFDPNNPSAYTYKITTNDTDGNISVYSSEISDTPNGTGGSDSTPPTISSVVVSDINTTSATITWTTDELSSSYVGYSTQAECDAAPGGVCPYLPERGLASMVTSHEITLTGLDSDTTYNIRVKSYDAIGNLGQNDKDAPGSSGVLAFTFSTLAGPEISSVAVDSNNTSATVSWATTTDSDTYVIFSDTVLNGALVNPLSVGTPDRVGGSPTFNHSQMITAYNDVPLISGETYYFYVTSKDASDVTAVDDNGGNFYSFSTTQDDDAPVISSIIDGDDAAGIVSHEKGVVSWTTDEPANSRVDYGTTSGDLTLSETVVTYDTSHFVILSGLDPNTTYYYTVTSADINTNEDTSIEYSFTTLRNPEEQHDPLTTITMLYNDGDEAGDPKIITDEKAVVAFNTDQPAQCTIEYGTESGNYNEVPVVESSYNENHSMHLTGLIFSTTYYYKITCADNLDNTVFTDEYSFITDEEQLGSGDLDSTAPEILSVGADVTSGESVTVTWDTDEEANSLVKYGIESEVYENYGGDSITNELVDNYATAHTVIINNLIPSTRYYYKVVSYDASGNFSESTEETFITASPSSLSSIKVISENLNEATITWTTSQKATSSVEYGLTTAYGDKKESSTLVTDHSITITGFTSGQVYHFRVKGQDADNNLYSSGDYTFEPKSPPAISNITISDVTERTAKIKFNTNVPTDANIIYTDAQNDKNSGSQGMPQLTSTHEVELKNLTPGATYTIKIQVKDEQGNQSEDKENKTFTAGKDDNPPEIDKIDSDSALTQSEKVQTIISWVTSEPATGALTYKEGINGEEKEIKISDEFSTIHSKVLTIFKPGTVYYFKAKSMDQSNNITVSPEYALLTPKIKENIIQVISASFQDIFGWVNF